jgi:hypothetical protein
MCLAMLVPCLQVTHKLAHGELVETENWLPEGPLTIGVTSGASTPDKAGECGRLASLCLPAPHKFFVGAAAPTD